MIALSNLIFLGAAAARDRILLTWTRDNELPLSEEHERSENTLILKNIQREDQGVYNCVGYNPSGIIVFRKSITLKVIGKFSSKIKYYLV